MMSVLNNDVCRTSSFIVKEKLTADPDSEIATTSLRVSLMCPVSMAGNYHIQLCLPITSAEKGGF